MGHLGFMRSRPVVGRALAAVGGSPLGLQVSGTDRCAMTVADDFGVPLVPQGMFAVVDPDPAERGRWTLWSTKQGRLRDYPEGVRWRPCPPRFDELTGDARREARDSWYTDVYWPWRRDVAEAVLADPVGAADAFRRVSGSVPLPDPPRWGGGEKVGRVRPVRLSPLRIPGAESEAARRRREEKTLAAVLSSAGKSVREIAIELGVSKSTAHRRAQSDGLPTSNAVARALLLMKVGDLERLYARGDSGADDARMAAALADLDRIRGILREGMGQ